MCRAICWGFGCHLSFRGKFSVLFIPRSPYGGSWCATGASLNCADSCTARSEHKILVTLRITNAAVECDGTSLWGEVPSPACSSNAAGGFTAPSATSGCCKDLLCCFAKGALWLNQGSNCRFYGHDLARKTYTSLLLYLLGGLCSQCWSPSCWDCPGALLPGQDKNVYTRCSDSSWTQSWPTVREGHLYIQKLHQLILESVQLNWYKPV